MIVLYKYTQVQTCTRLLDISNDLICINIYFLAPFLFALLPPSALFFVTSGLPCSSLTTASCSSVQHFCGGLCGCAHNGAFVAVTDASRLAILELDTQQWSLTEDRGSWLDSFFLDLANLRIIKHQSCNNL